jgi:hypothetical protein
MKCEIDGKGERETVDVPAKVSIFEDELRFSYGLR